jgi:hypothetical protein
MATSTALARPRQNQALDVCPPPQPPGRFSDSVGAGAVTIVVNILVGLVTGGVATALTAASNNSTPMLRAEAAKRGLVVGVTMHAAAMGGLGYVTAAKHPRFSAAVTYVGMTALGLAGLGALVPVQSFANAESTAPPSPTASGTPAPSPTVSNAGRLQQMPGGPAMDAARMMGAPRFARTAMDRLRPQRRVPCCA